MIQVESLGAPSFLVVVLSRTFTGPAEIEDPETAAIEALIEKRNQARAARDFATADALRDELTAMGVVVEDAGGVTRWRRRDN